MTALTTNNDSIEPSPRLPRICDHFLRALRGCDRITIAR